MSSKLFIQIPLFSLVLALVAEAVAQPIPLPVAGSAVSPPESIYAESRPRVFLNTGFPLRDVNDHPHLFVSGNGEFAVSYRFEGAHNQPSQFTFNAWHLPSGQKVAEDSELISKQMEKDYRNQGSAISGDGKYLLCSAGKSTVLFDIYANRVVKRLPGVTGITNTDGMWRIDPFSRDSELFWLIDPENKVVRVFKTNDGSMRRIISNLSAYRCEFSPDGEMLLAEANSGTSLINATTGTIVQSYEAQHIPDWAPAFNENGNRFMLLRESSDERSEPVKFQTENGLTVFERQGGQVRHFWANFDLDLQRSGAVVSLSPDGRRLVMGPSSSVHSRNEKPVTVKSYEIDSGRELADFDTHVQAARFSTDTFLVVGRSIQGTGIDTYGYQSSIYRYSFELIDSGTGEVKSVHRTQGDPRKYANGLKNIFTYGNKTGIVAQIEQSHCVTWFLEKAENDGVIHFYDDKVAPASAIKFSTLGPAFALGHRRGPGDETSQIGKPGAFVQVWDVSNGQPNSAADAYLQHQLQGSEIAIGQENVFYPTMFGDMDALRNQANNGIGELSTIGQASISAKSLALPPGNVAASLLSPDEKKLLIATVVDDLKKQKLAQHHGRLLVCQVFEVRTGKEISRHQGEVSGHAIGSIVFSPSGESIAAVRRFHPNAADLDPLQVNIWKVSEFDKGPVQFKLNRLDGGRRPFIPVFESDRILWLYDYGGLSRIDLVSGKVTETELDTPKGVGVFYPSLSRRVMMTDVYSHEGMGVGVEDTVSKRMLAFVNHPNARTVAMSPNGKWVVVACNDGWCELRGATDLKLACRFISLNSGRDWLVITPEGLFDGTHKARQRVVFRIGKGFNVAPVDRFFQDFYYPGLLAAIWRGERPVPKVQLGEQLPPLLAIESPVRSGDIDDRRVIVSVMATDQGGGIKGPSLRHNGATLIGAVQSTERTDDGIRRTFTVDLVEGQNTLEVVSASADGSFESEPVRVTLSYNKPLPKSRLHLLVVGIDGYTDESLKMNYAVGDADAIAALFKTRGGSLYENVNVMALRNDSATHQSILHSIRELAAVAKPQDTVVVFLSGHGAMVDQNFYFLPQDFRRDSTTLEEDIRRFGLATTDVGDLLAQVPALKRMVVFDTGQSGRALPVLQSTRNPFAFRGAIERLSRAQGAFTIASAAVSDEATEVPELGHGVLSYSFLAGLKAVESGPLMDQWVQPTETEKVAQALDLFSFTSSHTRRLGKEYFGQELDVQYSSSGMTFPVLPVEMRSAPVMATDLHSITQSPKAQTRPKESKSTKPQSLQATLHVVAVGINEYAQSSMNLRYAAPDAEAISELLVSRGQELFENVSVNTLLNEEATRVRILQTLQAVGDIAKPNDTLAIFFAGHGAMVGQRYYFVPHEFDNSESNLADESLRAQGVPADELGDAIAKIPALNRLLVFDTCASGGAIHLSTQGADPFAFRGAIEQLGKEGGTFTLAAVSSDAEAQEIKELGHGILSYCLLAGGGAIHAGPLLDRSLKPASGDSADVLEWFSYAAGNVPRVSRQYSGKEQHVQLGGTGKAFPILRVMPLPTDKVIQE